MCKRLEISLLFLAACFAQVSVYSQHKNHDGFMNLGVGVVDPNFSLTGVKLNYGIGYNVNFAYPVYKSMGIIMSLNGASHAIDESYLVPSNPTKTFEKVSVDRYSYYGLLAGLFIKSPFKYFPVYARTQLGYHFSHLPGYQIMQQSRQLDPNSSQKEYKDFNFEYISSSNASQYSGMSFLLGVGASFPIYKNIEINLDFAWLSSNRQYTDVFGRSVSTVKYFDGKIERDEVVLNRNIPVEIRALMINLGLNYALIFK